MLASFCASEVAGLDADADADAFAARGFNGRPAADADAATDFLDFRVAATRYIEKCFPDCTAAAR